MSCRNKRSLSQYLTNVTQCILAVEHLYILGCLTSNFSSVPMSFMIQIIFSGIAPWSHNWKWTQAFIISKRTINFNLAVAPFPLFPAWISNHLLSKVWDEFLIHS